jgi:hypothetical protein
MSVMNIITKIRKSFKDSSFDYFDLLYPLFAAGILLYGLYSFLQYLWSLNVVYFGCGVAVLVGLIFQVGNDIYHKKLGVVSKVLLFILIVATVLLAIADLLVT